jgi:exonuclease III
MNLSPLKIVSLNCHGLADPERRGHMFYFLRTLQADIICLQETHTTSEAARFWTQTWGGPAVWSHQVGILLAPRHKLTSFSFSHSQRVLCADVIVRGHSFSVANIYAPAQPNVRARFFEQLRPTLFDPTRFAFIAGDWNCCPDPIRDRWPTFSRPDDHWSILAPTLSSFVDAALQGAHQH